VAKANAKLLKLLVLAALHADHIVGATVAYLGASNTGIDTVLQMLGQCSIVLVHKTPLVAGGRLDNERQKTDQHLKHFRTDLKCLLNDNRRAKLLKTTPAARGGLNDSLLKNDNLS